MYGTLPETLWWCWPRSWGWGWRWWEGRFVSRAGHAGKEKALTYDNVDSADRCDQEACKRATRILLLRETRVKAGSWQEFLRYFPLNKTTNSDKPEPQTRGTETERGKPNTVSYSGLNAFSTTLNSPSWALSGSWPAFLSAQGHGHAVLSGFHGKQDSHPWLHNTAHFWLQWEARRWHSYTTLRTVLPAASAAEACSSVLGLEPESDGLSPSEV